MKKLLIIITLILVGFGIYKVCIKLTDSTFDNVKSVNEDVSKIKQEVIEKNVDIYIKAVNLSLEVQLFNGDVIGGKYQVNDSKIVNTSDQNIYYDIDYRGTLPKSSSTLYIENGQVVSADIYMDDYHFNYESKKAN